MQNIVAAINITTFDTIYSGINAFPEEGSEVYAPDFLATLGGGSPATLINLSRLGVPVKIGTFLGEDTYSRMALEEYRKMGVMPINLYQGKGKPVAVSTVISTTEDRTFISYAGSQDLVISDEKVYQFLKDSKYVYINECYNDVNEQLKKDGAILFYDTGWHDNFTLINMKRTLRLADYYTPNLREALALTGKKTPEEALEALAQYTQNPIIKLSKEGCLFKENGVLTHVKEIKEFRCVDSTGAGDAFMAGLIYGIFNGYNLKESVVMGNITGGKAVEGIGCLTEYLSQQQFHEYYNRYKYL